MNKIKNGNLLYLLFLIIINLGLAFSLFIDKTNSMKFIYVISLLILSFNTIDFEEFNDEVIKDTYQKLFNNKRS